MNWKEAAQNVPENDSTGYLKFKQGATKFRVLSAPVQGWEYWTADNKPVRLREYPQSVPADIRGDSKIKFFWAFVVWNLDLARVQILELTQSTIINAMRDLINSEDYGDPTGYSITVNRKGEGLDTEYSVIPSPPKETPANVLAAYKKANINLEVLFEGGNPFEHEEVQVDPNDVPFD